MNTQLLYKYALDRLKEASTWRGFVMFAIALGLQLDPDQAEAVIKVGVTIAAAIGVFFPDTKSKV